MASCSRRFLKIMVVGVMTPLPRPQHSSASRSAPLIAAITLTICSLESGISRPVLTSRPAFRVVWCLEVWCPCSLVYAVRQASLGQARSPTQLSRSSQASGRKACRQPVIRAGAIVVW